MTNLYRWLSKVGDEAGVPWIGFHSFRHTTATRLFRSGWNAKQVQLLLGHHSPSFTPATYVHVMADELPDPIFEGGNAGGNQVGTKPAETSRAANPQSAADLAVSAGKAS